jgi:tRNA(fMet)-specific endonuclease VapC
MSLVLVDTDVFSYLFKGDTRGKPYLDLLRDHSTCVSFMTVAELKLWALKHRWGRARRESLLAALRHYTVLPFDDSMTDAWAEVQAERARAGKVIGASDCWVAATALCFGLPLVTNNRTHYQGIGGLEMLAPQ